MIFNCIHPMKTLKRIALIIICTPLVLIAINILLKLIGLRSIFYYAGCVCGFVVSVFHHLFG